MIDLSGFSSSDNKEDGNPAARTTVAGSWSSTAGRQVNPEGKNNNSPVQRLYAAAGSARVDSGIPSLDINEDNSKRRGSRDRGSTDFRFTPTMESDWPSLQEKQNKKAKQSADDSGSAESNQQELSATVGQQQEILDDEDKRQTLVRLLAMQRARCLFNKQVRDYVPNLPPVGFELPGAFQFRHYPTLESVLIDHMETVFLKVRDKSTEKTCLLDRIMGILIRTIQEHKLKVMKFNALRSRVQNYYCNREQRARDY